VISAEDCRHGGGIVALYAGLRLLELGRIEGLAMLGTGMMAIGT